MCSYYCGVTFQVPGTLDTHPLLDAARQTQSMFAYRLCNCFCGATSSHPLLMAAEGTAAISGPMRAPLQQMGESGIAAYSNVKFLTPWK